MTGLTGSGGFLAVQDQDVMFSNKRMSMNYDWKIISFMSCWAALSIFSFWRIMVNTGKVYKGLDDIWMRAKQNDLTNGQLLSLRVELVQFHKDYCHVRHYGDYARKVLAYIDGRIKGT